MGTYTKFHATSSGNTIIVPAPGAGKRVVVSAIFFMCGALTEVTLRSGTSSGGELTGPMQFQTGGGLNLPSAGFDLFMCAENQPLVVKLAGLGPDCAGALIYDVTDV